ncbi:MAG: hypothetical protein QXG41_07470 [Candidatus Caldarchaeum sp.]|uniref:Uncharacterized protein n=1 Tax=Caldiarchaeum subterraneum TaxID=311458 RepID=A0A7J3G5X7_CALS0
MSVNTNTTIIRLQSLSEEELENAIASSALPLFQPVLVQVEDGDLYEVWAEGWSIECVAEKLPTGLDEDELVYEAIFEKAGEIIETGWDGYVYVGYEDDDYPFGVTVFYRAVM